MRMEERKAMCAKEFGLEDSVQGFHPGPPGLSGPWSGSDNLAGGPTRLSEWESRKYLVGIFARKGLGVEL